MSFEFLEQLTVDPKDLDCPICYARYTPIANEPLIIIPCEHTICSSCFKHIQDVCPFCKAEISQNPIKNQLLSSLLERDSQVKKCSVHKQPMDYYCKEDFKLACSHCFMKKNPDKFGSIQEIHSKMEDRKKAVQKLQNEKEETMKNINEKIFQGAQNLKRKLDDLFDERLAQEFEKQKKLKSSLDVIMFTEKEQYEHQLGLSKYEEDYKRLENWENSPEENNVVERIFKTSLSTKQATQFYNDKANKITRNIAELEKTIGELILESKSDFSESPQSLFEKVIGDSNLAPKYHQEIAREYLLSTFEDHGIVADYQEDRFELKEKPQVLSKLKKFYPDLFKCSIEKLDFSCSLTSDREFTVLCEILLHIQSLSNLSFSLLEPSPTKIELISNLILSSKTLRNISFSMPFLAGMEAFKKYIQNLLHSQRISGLSLELGDNHFINFHQDLVLFPALPTQTKKPLEEFSANFLNNCRSYGQILRIISNALNKTTALRKVKFSFGDRVNYALFIQELCLALRKCSHTLQELDLGFANVRFLNSGLSQLIFQVIINSKELKKLTLFLAGDELSDDVFDDLFYVEKGEIPIGHKLEEFSLTLMQCDDVELDEVLEFLRSFPQLKRFILRINRVDIDFQRITDFLENILQLKSLISFDFACRDFGRLTAKKKKDLDVCKYRLSLYKIQHKIVFEQLRPEHLPDYVSFVPQEDEEEDDEDEAIDIAVQIFEGEEEDFEGINISEEEEEPHEEKTERKIMKAARQW